jgi:hypothetical protein
MTCVTTGDPVLNGVTPLQGPNRPQDGCVTTVLQPLPVAEYSSYRTPPSERTRYFGAKPQRADARARSGGRWSA